MDTKHTPTPWIPDDPRFTPDVEQANVEFLLRAVNAHEELLEAAKEFRDLLELKANNRDTDYIDWLSGVIAKAEGK